MLAARLSECYWWEKPAANENVRRRNHLFESDTAGATTAEYIWLGNQRLAKAEGNNLYFMHTDHLGTVQLLTNNTGAVVWSGDYKPFGDVTETVTTVTNNLRFPGQMFDEETGLHYNYFRDYDPSIGRYITSDPIGLNAGVNTYVYVLNSPIIFYDDLGLRPFRPARNNIDFVDNLVNGLDNFNQNTQNINNNYSNSPAPPVPPGVNDFLNPGRGSYMQVCKNWDCPKSCPVSINNLDNCWCTRWVLEYVRHR